MINLVSLCLPVLGLFNLYQETGYQKDSIIDKLHYKITCGLFLVCSIVLSATDLIGENIKCLSSGLPVEFIELYCWKNSKFTHTSKSVFASKFRGFIRFRFGEESTYGYS